MKTMEDKPVMLIDNKSPFCCKIMKLIYKSGGYNKFNFISIYSDESKELLARYSLSQVDKMLLVLIEQEKIYFNSIAILHSAEKLNAFIPIFYCYTVLPGGIKNFKYKRINEFFSNNE